MWNGRQIVSKKWVKDMTSVHVNASDVGFDQLSFGYYWWIDTRRNVALMDGKGGQYVFVDRANRLLVVITSDPNDAQGLLIRPRQQSMMPLLGPSIRSCYR